MFTIISIMFVGIGIGSVSYTHLRFAASQASLVSSAALSEIAGVIPDQWNQSAPYMIALSLIHI